MSRRIGFLVTLFAVCLLSSGSALAADKIKGKGVITLRSGDTLTVETADDTTVTVVVTPDTKIQHPVGLTGVRKKQVGNDVLIPGLKLKYEGTGDENRVTAETITFDRDDLTLAKVIRAGLNPTAQETAVHTQQIARGKAAIEANQQEIEANKQMIAANQNSINEVAQSTKKRFSELGQYDVKDQTTVYFGTGDYTVTDEYKQKLKDLAKEALESANPKAYLIQVSGFADSVGSAASNQVLSKRRAEAVVAYLLQECGIPVGRIVAPGALGETNPAASNESASGKAENRRVEVKLLINKGIAGGN
jgi:outer membrane protein OmpA-like peptidoglycan-associated protein